VKKNPMTDETGDGTRVVETTALQFGQGEASCRVG